MEWPTSTTRWGGGVYKELGAVTFRDCVFRGNVAYTGAACGTGIAAATGLRDCSFC